MNYLREATEELRRVWIPSVSRKFQKEAAACADMLRHASAAPKFSLPENGFIFDDNLRGLPEKLVLPYPNIVIEYNAHGESPLKEICGSTETTPAPKRIIFARQKDKDAHIAIVSFVQFVENGVKNWEMRPWAAVIFRDAESPHDKRFSEAAENAGVKIPHEDLRFSVHAFGEMALSNFGLDWKHQALFDMNGEVGAVLSLIEALSCSNVTHEAIPARKLNKSAQKRGALPFDEYRVLVLKNRDGAERAAAGIGSGRSPREHLRRGHIRRLADGRKIWVNSTVVNPGAGGKIAKAYDLTRIA